VGGISVLLVEDDDRIRDALPAAMRDAGLTVDAIPLAAGLFDALRRRAPDIVVLDLGMPRGSMQGMETLTRMREHDAWRTIPVIILSAFGDVVNRDLTQRLGVAAILGKPFEAEHLIACVERAVSRRASLPRAADDSAARTRCG
jgi:DNA-binding response OmpR family regulator